MKYELEPMGERLLVERVSEEKVGVIIMPDSKRKVSLRGKVLKTGPDCVWVEEGDNIFFGRYASFSLPLEDLGENEPKEILIMNEQDVLAKIISMEDANE